MKTDKYHVAVYFGHSGSYVLNEYVKVAFKFGAAWHLRDIMLAIQTFEFCRIAVVKFNPA